jgi:ATP-dependent RNA helicase SUPV3L1/SUV3
MGLNMDLDHVAFARIGKFDGRGPRRLSPAEIAQIAGRAGRHMSDGTFGATAEQGLLEPEVVNAIEAHRFEPLTRLNWRNSRLRFDSIAGLLRSLDERPSLPGLVQAREADDHRALQALARNPEIVELAAHPGAVRLLWEVCQIPDFRKVMSESHTRLLAHCFLHLAGPEERLPIAWVAAQMASLDRIEGDIDTLMSRIAHIRTWTYITHRGDWVENSAEWQERARGIEDRLSDALHESITQRFVDRRSAFLVRQLASEGELLAAVSRTGEVLVEGAYVGRIDGLRFVPDSVDGVDGRMLVAAAGRVLRGEIAARTRLLATDPDDAFTIGVGGELRWRGGVVGRLVAGEKLSSPRAEPSAGDLIDGEARERVRRRLQLFLRNEIERRLAPLFAAQALPLGGVGRGLVYQLVDALGCLPAANIAGQVAALESTDRKALSRLGLRFGTESVYFEPLLRVDAVRFRALLWGVLHGRPAPAPPSARRLSKPIQIDPDLPASFYMAIGLRVLGGIAIRPDRLERLAAAARRLARRGPFTAGAELAAIAGVEPRVLRGLLEGLGYRPLIDAGGETFVARPRRRRETTRGSRRSGEAHEAHPFAKLRELKLA